MKQPNFANLLKNEISNVTASKSASNNFPSSDRRKALETLHISAINDKNGLVEIKPS